MWRYLFNPFVLGFFLPVFFYNSYAVVSGVKTMLSSNPKYTHLPKYRPLVIKIHKLMLALNPYYQKLGREGRERFISRLIYVLPQKKFVGKEGLDITIEKRIIVLSALVQLTFGLKSFTIRRFNQVILYPSTFFSKLIKREVKGLTVGVGNVLLSWFDTYKGLHFPTDNLHLELHEWAHAFQLNHEMDEAGWIYSRLELHMRTFDGYYERILKFKEEKNYLRDYAFTNVEEFFAVSIEHFFETPEEFIKSEPELYAKMCKLLNQNPLNPTLNYKLR